MKRFLFTLNSSILFFFVSVQLGLGAASRMLPNEAVTSSQSVMTFAEAVSDSLHTITKLVLALALLLLVEQWKRGLRWVPIVLLGTASFAAYLSLHSLPHLAESLSATKMDPPAAAAMASEWLRLHDLRVKLWAAQWLAMMAFFGRAYFKLEKAI